MTFANRKFMGFLAAATVVIVAEYILVLSDCVIAGRVLGEDALGAVNLLMPVFSGASFFTWLLALGTSIVYSDAIARVQRERAAQLAGQGLVASVLMGLALALATLALKGPYLAFMAPGADTAAFWNAYLRWYPLVIVLESVDMLLLYLSYADGGERSCLVSYCAQVLVNVFLSYGLCSGSWGLPELGMSGISLGTVVAYLVGISLLLPRFFNSRVCGIRFRPKFLPRELARSLKASFGDASVGLYQALLFFVVTKYVVHCWGPDGLPVLAVVFCIVRLTVFFNGVGIALQPLETVYHGEGNTTGVNSLVRFAAVISLAESLLISGIVFVCPDSILALVGIGDPELLDVARRCARLTVTGLAGYAIAYLLNSHYQFVGRPSRSIVLTALAFFVVPVAIMPVLCWFLDEDGVWIALAAGPAIAVGMSLVLDRRAATDSKDPLMWSLKVLDGVAIPGAVDEIEKSLSARLPTPSARRIADVVGLALRHIRANNGDRRRVNVEITVEFTGDDARMIVRDDGLPVALDNLGVAVQHLPTSGFNRNVFFFPLVIGGDRYDVLHGSEIDIRMAEGIAALDRLSFDPRFQSPAKDDYERFLTNRENGIVIVERTTGKVVGYSMLVPVSDETYERIRSGTFLERDLTPEMVSRYDGEGFYNLYFMGVVIHPEHRNARMVMTLLDAMAEDFISLFGRGICIKRMVADVVSRNGVKFCRLFGLRKVCSTDHGSTIYEVSGLPPMFRETTPTMLRLSALYRGKYAALHGDNSCQILESIMSDGQNSEKPPAR